MNPIMIDFPDEFDRSLEFSKSRSVPRRLNHEYEEQQLRRKEREETNGFDYYYTKSRNRSF